MKKCYRVCYHCLHNHAKDMKFTCDLKGEIKLPWESYCNEFQCFSCSKTEQEKCECYYDEIKAKYRIGE